LVSLSEVVVESIADYDLIGLATPVYYFQEPFNVRDFIEHLPVLNGQHWFQIATHGSALGITFRSMTDRLERKGALIVGYHDTYASSSLPFYPYPMQTHGHPDASELDEALLFGKEIVSRARKIAAGNLDLVPSLKPVREEWVKAASDMTMELMDKVFPRLEIDEDRCVQCGDCADGCPVSGIDPEADPPRIQEPCIYCWCCVNRCPEVAIRADWSLMLALAPQNIANYRRWLDEAAAEGRFKWLLDPDSIDPGKPLLQDRENAARNGPPRR
jgi:ferredoxin